MRLLQSLSYRWAEKRDNRSLFSSMHSASLGSPVVTAIGTARARRGLLGSSAIIPARAG